MANQPRELASEPVTMHPLHPDWCPFRKQRTILSDNDGDEKYQKTDADLIMTAAALGFCKILLDKNHPVEITASKKNIDSLTKTVRKINAMFMAHPLDRAGKLSVTVTKAEDFDQGERHHWEKEIWNVITGDKGGSGRDFESRDKIPEVGTRDEKARATVESLKKTLWQKAKEGPKDEAREEKEKRIKKEREEQPNKTLGSDIGYQDIGAYTGLVVYADESRVSLMSTKEVDIEVPDRWVPSDKCTCQDEGEIWGKLDSEWHTSVRQTINARRGEANVVRVGPPDHLVGYVHGMIQAIYICEADGKDTTVPFEIAAGEKTTKLASCFPCTLFMYAAGYPPSAIHMDSGLSWVPFEPEESSSSEQEMVEKALEEKHGRTIDKAIKDTNGKWHKFCKEILDAGMTLLNAKKESVSEDGPKKIRGKDVEFWHTTRLSVLESYLKTLAADKAGYLILDAVTVHDKDSSRINRTISNNILNTA